MQKKQTTVEMQGVDGTKLGEKNYKSKDFQNWKNLYDKVQQKLEQARENIGAYVALLENLQKR